MSRRVSSGRDGRNDAGVGMREFDVMPDGCDFPLESVEQSSHVALAERTQP